MNPVRNKVFGEIFNPTYKHIADVDVDVKVWNAVFPSVSGTLPLSHDHKSSMLYLYNPGKKQ